MDIKVGYWQALQVLLYRSHQRLGDPLPPSSGCNAHIAEVGSAWSCSRGALSGIKGWEFALQLLRRQRPANVQVQGAHHNLWMLQASFRVGGQLCAGIYFDCYLLCLWLLRDVINGCHKCHHLHILVELLPPLHFGGQGVPLSICLHAAVAPCSPFTTIRRVHIKGLSPEVSRCSQLRSARGNSRAVVQSCCAGGLRLCDREAPCDSA
mmetsp:Transcript_6025/g.16051  ORF Transcript_6025/g.16051 Transcript_6025/m.16051 type:complete len:208 (-) Transcript_6025:1836-2459(-)